MASVAFGSSTVAAAAVAPASGRRTRPARRSVLPAPPAATRGGPAPPKEEKGLGEIIFGFIFKKDQLVETDPLLNKVGGGAPAAASSRAKPPPRGAATTAGKKAAGGDEGGSGGGFNLGGLGGFFAKKSS